VERLRLAEALRLLRRGRRVVLREPARGLVVRVEAELTLALAELLSRAAADARAPAQTGGGS
jgi:hypothetical protein